MKGKLLIGKIMNRQILLLMIIMLHLKVFQLHSQLSCGGTPLSFRENLKASHEIPRYYLPAGVTLIFYEPVVNE
jgi:hypothetical protein